MITGAVRCCCLAGVNKSEARKTEDAIMEDVSCLDRLSTAVASTT